MWNTFLSVITHYKDYFAAGGYGLLLFLCLLYFAAGTKKSPDQKALFWPTLIMLLVIFCPVTAKIIMKMVGEDVYWRTFWVLPVVILAASAGTDLIAMIAGRKKQILAVLLCTAALALNGTFLFNGEYFQAKENNYKLPTEVIWVADAINEHALENKIKLKKIAAPYSVATYIRVYDASIRQKYGRLAEQNGNGRTQLYVEVNSDAPDYEVLAERAQKAKLRYVVLLSAADNEEAMNAINYEKVYTSPSYAVYFNRYYEKD
ncbi:MAG: hypothetical protein PHE06_14810 [Lachnospiraceae bacterium]|nr:hypothetical protein [Lachnospiraceae bacterium]